MTLYHYTCEHAALDIGERGTLRPHLGLIWLTDLDVPMRDALGLTSNTLACDRTAFRYRVLDDTPCMWWIGWSRLRQESWRPWVAELEAAPGVRPVHWWVSTAPVPVVADPTTNPTRGAP